MTTPALALALVLATAPRTAEPSPPRSEASARQVTLAIDHTALLEHQDPPAAEETARFLRQDGEKALREVHGVTVVDAGAAPIIEVELGWVDYAQSIYRITMQTRRPGQDARVLDSFECACIDSGVIEAVVQRLPAALEQLDEPPPSAEPAAPVEPEASASPDQAPPDHESPSGAPISAVGIAGIIVTGAGAGALGFGISRLVKGVEYKAEPDEQRELIYDYRPQGRAWLGIGVGTMVVGTTMLVLDLTLLRRRRTASISLGPALGPSMTGLQLHGRF